MNMSSERKLPKPTTRKSRYTPDGSYLKTIPVAETVGDLIHSLSKLPKDLPLQTPLEPVWYNVGQDGQGCNQEHLGFRDGEDE